MIDKRKSPRIQTQAPYSIVHHGAPDKLLKNIVISKNLSATGFCFRASTPFEAKSQMLISFKNQNIENQGFTTENLVRVGAYFLAQVQWCASFQQEDKEIFEIGCRFLEKQEADLPALENFTQFVNHLIWQEMP